jgi:hypothetical protein
MLIPRRHPLGVVLDTRRVVDPQLPGGVIDDHPRHVDGVLQERPQHPDRPPLDHPAEPVVASALGPRDLQRGRVQEEEPLQLLWRRIRHERPVSPDLLIRQELNSHNP